MAQDIKPIVILLVDDDADDRMLARDALAESRLANDLREVEDGEQLLDYLHRRGKYADPAESPRPGLILLDLNMPRKDGREALKEIKADASLRHILSHDADLNRTAPHITICVYRNTIIGMADTANVGFQPAVGEWKRADASP